MVIANSQALAGGQSYPLRSALAWLCRRSGLCEVLSELGSQIWSTAMTGLPPWHRLYGLGRARATTLGFSPFFHNLAYQVGCLICRFCATEARLGALPDDGPPCLPEGLEFLRKLVPSSRGGNSKLWARISPRVSQDLPLREIHSRALGCGLDGLLSLQGQAKQRAFSGFVKWP